MHTNQRFDDVAVVVENTAMPHISTSLSYARSMCVVQEFKTDLTDNFIFSVKRKSFKENLKACNASLAFMKYMPLHTRLNMSLLGMSRHFTMEKLQDVECTAVEQPLSNHQ
jgi:hypothetical protein